MRYSGPQMIFYHPLAAIKHLAVTIKNKHIAKKKEIKMFNKKLLHLFKDKMSLVMAMVLCQWIMLLANVLVMFTATSFLQTLVETSLGGLVNLKAQKNLILGKALILLGVLILALIIRVILSYINSNISFKASSQVKSNLRNLIFEKLMSLGSSYTKDFTSGEITQLTTEGVDQLEIYFGKYIPQFFYALLAPLTLFLIICPFSFKCALILLVCVPLIPLAIVAVQKFAKKLLSKYWGKYTQMGDSFLECMQALTTLKIYDSDKYYAKKLDDEAESFRKITMRVLIMQLNSVSVMDLVAYGGTALGVILAVCEFKADAISLAQTLFIIMISAEFFLPMRLLGSYFHIAMNGNAAAVKIFKLLETPVDNNSIGEEKLKDKKEIIIKAQKINFSYKKDMPVLKDISIEVKKGLTAFAGESGCGKSTLAKLLLKEEKVQSGQIELNGININNLSKNEILKNITCISNDSYLFAGSVKENLLMAKKNASDKELYRVLKEVQLDSFIKKEGGLDYMLLEKATNLSGGQKQRLALARALLHDSKVYIFDEATSNVDIESENAIMNVVKKLSKTKTVILISHRLANVKEAQNIYVLKDGKICQSGEHKKLMSKNGLYKKLYTQQMELENFNREAQ